MFALVIPFGQSFDDVGFTYIIPETFKTIIKIGQIVKIPFGKKEILGCIVDILPETSVNKEKLKEIKSVLYNESFLYDYQIEILNWISKKYFTLAHNSLGLFFPKNLLGKIVKEKFKFTSDFKEINYSFENGKILNQNQQKIFEEIKDGKENKFLLYGVTGSGKTEIYINLIKHYLDNKKQSLFLVPEIVLNDQIFERIKKVFGDEVLVINSSVSEAKKTKYWEQIYSGNAKIIIGTRSSIFYPYKDLGLIIIDEEHDNSYISDITPRYSSLEVVNKISDLVGCKLVLGSATPKINDMYDALNGKYKLLSLFEEFE